MINISSKLFTHCSFAQCICCTNYCSVLISVLITGVMICARFTCDHMKLCPLSARQQSSRCLAAGECTMLKQMTTGYGLSERIKLDKWQLNNFCKLSLFLSTADWHHGHTLANSGQLKLYGQMH